MKYEDFEKFVREKCMYDTIYDDSDGRPILIIRMLDAYSMVNKAQREWVGLTEGETIELALNAFALPDFPIEARLQLQNELVIAMNTADSRMMRFAALIEAKLEEKNA